MVDSSSGCLRALPAGIFSCTSYALCSSAISKARLKGVFMYLVYMLPLGLNSGVDSYTHLVCVWDETQPYASLYSLFPQILCAVINKSYTMTTSSGGSLGSLIDEERS